MERNVGRFPARELDISDSQFVPGLDNPRQRLILARQKKEAQKKKKKNKMPTKSSKSSRKKATLPSVQSPPSPRTRSATISDSNVASRTGPKTPSPIVQSPPPSPRTRSATISDSKIAATTSPKPPKSSRTKAKLPIVESPSSPGTISATIMDSKVAATTGPKAPLPIVQSPPSPRTRSATISDSQIAVTTSPKASAQRKRKAVQTPSPPKRIGTRQSPRLFHPSFDKEANVDNATPKSSTIREEETVSLPNIGPLLDSAVEGEATNLSSLGTKDHPASPPPTPQQRTSPISMDQDEENLEELSQEATVIELALPSSSLAPPPAILDVKAPATFGNLEQDKEDLEEPSAEPTVLETALQSVEEKEDEEEIPQPTTKNIDEKSSPSSTVEVVQTVESPISTVNENEEEKETVEEKEDEEESPISTVNENEEEKSQPTTKSMDEKSSSSSSVEVLPTPKSRETIPHSIEVYKPPRKTDAEMHTDAMDLHEFIMQRKREGKGVDTQSVDESTQESGAKTYLHLRLGLVQPTVDLVQPPVSIDEYLVQTGLIERPFREVSVKPVENYESFPYRPTKVKGKWLEPRKPAGIRKFVFISPFQPGNIGEDLPTPEPFQAEGETGGDEDDS